MEYWNSYNDNEIHTYVTKYNKPYVILKFSENGVWLVIYIY